MMSNEKPNITIQTPFWVDQEENEAEENEGGREEDEKETVNKLLRGEKLLSDLPPRKIKGIRMYVSCPPNELLEERRQLAKNVYRHLYEYCWNNYGVECMITDLKIDQTKNWDLLENVDLCKKEIRRCQQTCMGPGLLVLCDDASSAYVVSHLLSSLDENFESRNKEPERKKSDADDNVDDDDKRSARSHSHFSDKDFNSDFYARKTGKKLSMVYNTVFGIELREGLICRDQALNKQNIVFTRNVAHIEEEMTKNVERRISILKYKDAGTSDVQYYQEYMQHIKCSFVRLPKENGMCTANYHCSQNNGLCGKDAYMAQSLKQHINSCLSRHECEEVSKKKQYAEILNHWYYAKQLTKTSVYRDDIPTIFDNYLCNKTTWPLVVIGEKATGKSTLIALLALKIQQRLQQHAWKNICVVLHFIGLTRESSSIREILFSICSQIVCAMGRNVGEVPNDYTGVKTFFRDLVQKCPFRASIVILLDNIEYLHSTNNEERFEWLPLVLAENVKIIFTSNETEESFYTHMNNKVSRYFQLGILSLKESEEIWNKWIAASGLDYRQINAASHIIKNCKKIGIQKILLESINRFWPVHSGDSVNEEMAFDQYLNHLEKKHGKNFVCISVGLLAMAAPMGLSEIELQMLSKSIFDTASNSNNDKHWIDTDSIAYRWCCLYNDLNWFLVECVIDGVSVLTLPIGHLLSQLKQRYLTNCDQHQKIKNALYKFHDFCFDKHPIDGIQPLYFPIVKKWNVRKINMITHILAQRSYREEFKTRLLYNYNWLVCKLQATSLDDVLKDFETVKNDIEVDLISETLQMSRSELQNRADFLCFELLGRLLPVKNRFSNIRCLLDQCDQAILKEYHLAPLSQLYMAPGGPLKRAQYQSVKEKDADVMLDMFQTESGMILVMYRSGSKSATGIVVKNLKDDLIWEEPKMPSKNVLLSRDGKYTNVFLSQDLLVVIQSSNGNVHGVIETGLHQSIGCCRVSSEHYIAFTSNKGVGPIIIDIENCIVIHRMEYYVQAMAFSTDESHFVLYTRKRIILFSIPCFERRGMVKMEEVPRQLILSHDSKECVSLSRTGAVILLYFDWTTRNFSTQEVFYNVDLQQMTLSTKGDIVLLLSSKKLFLYQVRSANTIFDLEFSADVLIEKISNFVSAAFSSTNDFVIGLRWTYVGIWNTLTGTILRILKTSDNTPFKKLLIPKNGLEFYTLTDRKLETWDLKLIESDVQFKPNIFDDPVKDLAMSTNGQRAICCTFNSPEAKVLDVPTGLVILCLLHGYQSLNNVTHVEISPDAQFAVTFSNWNEDGCRFLRESILWDIRRQNPKKLHHFGSCRFVLFPATSDLLFIIYCQMKSNIANLYRLMVSNPIADNQENYITLPQGIEFITKPSIITAGTENAKKTFLVAILWKDSSLVPLHSTSLLLMEFGSSEVDNLPETNLIHFEEINLKQLYSNAQTTDGFYDMKTMHNEKVLLVFSKNVCGHNLDLEHFLQLSSSCEKIAIIFNAVTKETLTFIQDGYFIDNFQIPDRFLSPDIFENIKNIIVPTRLTDLDRKSKYYLVTDGRWSVGLSDDLRYIHLVSLTRKKTEAISVPIHGRAVCVDLSGDGHTLAVGCKDGRILFFSITLSSPRNSEVSSRVQRAETQIHAPETLLRLDISRADTERQSQIFLSAKFKKEKLEEFYRPQSSKKLIVNARSFNKFRLLC